MRPTCSKAAKFREKLDQPVTLAVERDLASLELLLEHPADLTRRQFVTASVGLHRLVETAFPDAAEDSVDASAGLRVEGGCHGGDALRQLVEVGTRQGRNGREALLAGVAPGDDAGRRLTIAIGPRDTGPTGAADSQLGEDAVGELSHSGREP